MNTENKMNEEIRQLLDSLEEHGKNVHRQQELSDLIDRLDLEEKTVEMPRKHKKFTPLWWAMGAAAAVLLLWLLVKPTSEQTPKMNEEILVEKMETVDSVQINEYEFVFEKPVFMEELLAEETPVVPQKNQMKKEKPKVETIEKVVEQPVFAEVTTIESADTTNIGFNNISTESETPSAVQSPKRRVIRSLNLVCYECQKDPEPYTKPVLEDKTLFGQPQDPNMKNGSLAFEIKLN